VPKRLLPAAAQRFDQDTGTHLPGLNVDRRDLRLQSGGLGGRHLEKRDDAGGVSVLRLLQGNTLSYSNWRPIAHNRGCRKRK
jgi:hypothetical protein